jgi:hypothetical protein
MLDGFVIIMFCVETDDGVMIVAFGKGPTMIFESGEKVWKPVTFTCVHSFLNASRI